MDKLGCIIFGALISTTIALGVKVSYEFGRYSAVDDIYKKGWKIIDEKGKRF